MSKLSLIAISLLLVLLNNQVSAIPPVPIDDEVLYLLGVTDLKNTVPETQVYNKEWYSGKIKLDDENTVQYWFFPSQSQPKTDPLTLWLNGGPGCSSLLGATYQNGPFIFNPDTQSPETFITNTKSWNTNNNMLYFESPPGSGFSLASPNWPYDDDQSVAATYAALKFFFDAYPTYLVNEFYLAGEDYAGVFIPKLAKFILDNNSKFFAIDIRGILVGNPCTTDNECQGVYNEKFYQYLYNRAFISKSSFNNIQASCNSDSNSQSCKDATNDAQSSYDGTNIYNTIIDCNLDGSSLEFQQGIFAANMTGINLQKVQGSPSCISSIQAYTYFNLPQVQDELHTPVNTKWTMCNQTISGNDTFAGIYKKGNNSYDIYPELIKQNLRIWVYSGDTDAVVPITSTLSWIRKLKEQLSLADLVPWNPWFYNSDLNVGSLQSGGHYWEIQGLSFVSFRGAGHMVPLTQQQQAYIMFNNFLIGKPMYIPQ